MKISKLRIAIILATVALVAAGLAAWYVVGSLDHRVAEAIERQGSALTGTRVRVSSVSVSLRDGRATIRGLRIANPEGFSGDDAVWVDSIVLTLDIGSIRKSPVVIEDLVLASPRVKFEMLPTGKSNLDELRRRVEKNSGGLPDPNPLRLRVVKMTTPNGKVKADLTAVGGKVEELALNTIRRSNVGGKAGVPAELIAQALLTALAKETGRAASQAGLSSYLNKSLGAEGGKLPGKLKGLFK